MKKTFNWIVMAVVVVLSTVACIRVPNLDTEDDVVVGDQNLVDGDEELLAQAEPDPAPAPARDEPEADPAEEGKDQQEVGPPAPAKTEPAPADDSEPAPEKSKTDDGEEGPYEVVLGVFKDRSFIYELYLWDKGVVVRQHNFYVTGKDGKKYWPTSKERVILFVSPHFQLNTVWFIRPNDSCYCDGSFAMKVPVDATHIVRNGVQFDVISLDAPYHNCKGTDPCCGKTIWDLIQKGEDIAFYMEGEVKPGSTARTYKGFIPVGSDTFIGREDFDPRSGETRSIKHRTHFDTLSNVWAFPEMRMYKGQKGHNIAFKKVGK